MLQLLCGQRVFFLSSYIHLYFHDTSCASHTWCTGVKSNLTSCCKTLLWVCSFKSVKCSWWNNVQHRKTSGQLKQHCGNISTTFNSLLLFYQAKAYWEYSLSHILPLNCLKLNVHALKYVAINYPINTSVFLYLETFERTRGKLTK